jgi:hypothetical protein
MRVSDSKQMICRGALIPVGLFSVKFKSVFFNAADDHLYVSVRFV